MGTLHNLRFVNHRAEVIQLALGNKLQPNNYQVMQQLENTSKATLQLHNLQSYSVKYKVLFVFCKQSILIQHAFLSEYLYGLYSHEHFQRKQTGEALEQSVHIKLYSSRTVQCIISLYTAFVVVCNCKLILATDIVKH